MSFLQKDEPVGGSLWNHPDYRVKSTIAISRSHITRYTKCIFLLSINPFREDFPAVAKCFRTAKQIFPRCDVGIGDGLLPATIAITQGRHVDHAAIAAVITKDQVERFVETSKSMTACETQNLAEGEKPATLIYTSQMMKTAEFRLASSRILHLVANADDDFRSAIQKDAEKFVDRRARQGQLVIPRAEAVALCKQGFLDEYAIHLMLAEQGYSINIYDGQELTPLRRISAGLVHEAPLALRQSGCISLMRRHERRPPSVTIK